MAAEISMQPHPTSPHPRLVLARTPTRVYAVTYAEPYPSPAEAEALWRDERRAFRPYDETRGQYCA